MRGAGHFAGRRFVCWLSSLAFSFPCWFTNRVFGLGFASRSSATIFTNSFQFLTECICYRESLSKFRMNYFHCLFAYSILFYSNTSYLVNM